MVISDLRASRTAGSPQRSRLFGELRSRPHRDHVRTFVNPNALPGDFMYERIKGGRPQSVFAQFTLSLVSGAGLAIHVGRCPLQPRHGLPHGVPAEAGSNRASQNTNQSRFRGSWSGLPTCWAPVSEGLTQELVSGFRKRVLPGTA